MGAIRSIHASEVMENQLQLTQAMALHNYLKHDAIIGACMRGQARQLAADMRARDVIQHATKRRLSLMFAAVQHRVAGAIHHGS